MHITRRLQAMTLSPVCGVLLLAFAAENVLSVESEPASAPSTLPATQPSTAPSEIDTLVRELASDNWRQRDAAQDKLLELGDDVEPVLKRFVEETDSPEARSRAQGTLARIAERRWTGPSLVTLHRHGVAPNLVLDELFKQAGGEYTSWPPNLFQDGSAGVIDADFDHKPFLSALKEVCGKAGLNARNVYDRRRMTLIREQMAPMCGPAIVEGPVLICADGVDSSAQVRFANPGGAQRSGSLSLNVLLEPRLRITDGWVEVSKLEDENGKSLLLDGNAAARATGNPDKLDFNSEFFWTVRVPIELPRDGRKITKFRGNLHLRAHARTERVEIRDILKAREVTKVVDGRRFILHDVTPSGSDYQIHMTLYRDAMSAEDWAWFAYPYARVRLVDADGHDLSPTNGGGGGGTESTFNMTMTRQAYGQPPPGEPTALVWELPARTRDLVVPVSFDDLPLP